MIPPGEAFAILAGLTMALVGIGLLVHWRAGRAVQVLGALLVFRGVANAAIRYGGLADPVIFSFDAIEALKRTIFPGTGLVLLYFVSVYPKRRGIARHRAGEAALIGAIAGVGVLGWAAPDLYIVPGSTAVPGLGVLGWLATASVPGYALASIVYARDHNRATPGRLRTSLLLLATGLALDPAYLGMRDLGSWIAGVGPTRPRFLGWSAAGLATSITCILLLRGARRPDDPSDARQVRWATATVAAALVAGVAVATLSVTQPPLGVELDGFLQGVTLLALPGLITYGVLRNRFLGLELKLKAGIRQGSVVAAIVLGTVALTEVLGTLLPDPPDAIIGLSALALVIPLFGQLQRFGARVADVLLPQVEASKSYLEKHKLAVYTAAVEASQEPRRGWDVREQARLERLRQQLGITEREHAIIQHLTRAQARRASDGWDAGTTHPGDTVLGRYRIERELGEGSQARALLATDTEVERQVVVKVLKASHDPRSLLLESQSLARIEHPNIVKIQDVGLEGERVLLVLDHVAGGSLADRVPPALPAGTFERVATGLLSALQAVHDAGLVHRDIKPSNVLLTAGGDPRLADFGIARDRERGHTRTAGPQDTRGTVLYMSPEQAGGRVLDHRSDLYSAALTLYEARTGRLLVQPRPGESPMELQIRVASGTGDPPIQVADPDLAGWFERALQPGPGDRFQSAREMRAALEEILPSRIPEGPDQHDLSPG